nr:hypothetical protein [Tanacetum cinerariifolium]GEY81686.1 hypothetical protein [Tanacetum cinerariifolium]
MDNDDPILTTMRFIPKHETVQKYDALLPDTLTNQAMKESDAYKSYYDFATRKVIPKPKYVRRSTREKTSQAPKASLSKILKAIANVAKSGKKKLRAKELETLSEVALSEAEQMKILIKRSKTQFHSSQASDLGAHEGTHVIPGVPDVPTYSQDDDNEQTESYNDGDDFVHPNLSTFDEEERYEEKLDEEEEASNQRFHTPSHFKSTDDDAYDEVTQGDNVEEEKLDEEKTNEEEEVNELYNDSSLVSSSFISNMLNPNPDTGFDFILNLNTESTSLVDVLVTTNDEILPLYITTLHPPPIPLIRHVQQTPISTPTIVPNKAQAENEDFINKLDENLKKIIKEQVKVQVKEQVSKILPRIEKFVNEQLKAEVQTCSSNEAKTSYAVASNLSELELKKILIDKMESNKSIHRSDQHKTLYKALIDAYEIDKVILETYGDTGSKRRRAGKEHESTSAPKDKTSKSTGSSKEGSKSKTRSTDTSAQAKEEVYTVKDLEEPAHHEFETEVYKATTNQLDWNNPEGQQYPHDLRKPLPLIPNSRGRRVILFDHFINNDLAYLIGVNRESARDVYFRNRIIAIKKLMIVEWHNYKHLEWITICRDDDKLYTFKEGDYNRLRLQEIEDMMLLLVQGKLPNLNIEERLALGVSLRMFTRSIVIQRHVEDL